MICNSASEPSQWTRRYHRHRSRTTPSEPCLQKARLPRFPRCGCAQPRQPCVPVLPRGSLRSRAAPRSSMIPTAEGGLTNSKLCRARSRLYQILTLCQNSKPMFASKYVLILQVVQNRESNFCKFGIAASSKTIC